MKRSAKLDRDKELEESFSRDLDALDRALVSGSIAESQRTEPQRRLLRVASRYVDELKKLKTIACPLSRNMLVSALLEAMLWVVCLDHQERSSKTRIWTDALIDKKTKQSKIPTVPQLSLWQLIAVVDELKLLRIEGVKPVQEQILARLNDSTDNPELHFSLPPTNHAKRNSSALNEFRKTRNSIHAMELIDDSPDTNEFVESLWMGLQVFALLKEIFGLTVLLKGAASAVPQKPTPSTGL